MMRIDKVILASDKNDKYLSFWPKVSEVWKNIGIDPILIFVGTEPIDLCKDDNVFFFDSKEINPGFIARNIRMLYPALFPNDICLLSDIDIMPLDKDYFLKYPNKLDSDSLLIFRSNLVTNSQIPICWNAAKGSLWGEIFKIYEKNDIYKTLLKWSHETKNDSVSAWYNDQIKLKFYVEKLQIEKPNKVLNYDDDDFGFRRLDRSNYTHAVKSIFNNEKYTDFHMPTPYTRNKLLIKLVSDYFIFNKKESLFLKYVLLTYVLIKRLRLNISNKMRLETDG